MASRTTSICWTGFVARWFQPSEFYRNADTVARLTSPTIPASSLFHLRLGPFVSVLLGRDPVADVCRAILDRHAVCFATCQEPNRRLIDQCYIFHIQNEFMAACF